MGERESALPVDRDAGEPAPSVAGADARADRTLGRTVAYRQAPAQASAPAPADPAPERVEQAFDDAGEPAQLPFVGRFKVLRKLGEGGMGVVYEAHDALLDRKVALKRVRFEGASARGRARLLREAQAMAKVAHANVVPIYEVGEQGDEVFLAMELVEGQTLSEWLGREPRSWREVLAMYAAAGHGLAAAHAKGIVHRDFKPGNVMVGLDGRPRVFDFGLAYLPAEDRTAPQGSPLDTTGSLSMTGAVVGTPSYMSPEHFRGRAIDARSDQFSFAVAVYRALFGAPPFEGSTLIVLGDNVCSGAVRPLPASEATREVPLSVVDAVTRALSPDPDARFPAIDDLLVELERPLQIDPSLDPGPGRTGRRIAVAALGLFSVLSLVSIGLFEPAEVTQTAMLIHSSVALTVLLCLGIAFRKALAASAHNRRLGLVFVALCVSFAIHRAVAIRFSAPLAETLVGDALAVGVVFTLAGFTVERWMIAGAPVSIAYALFVVVSPRSAGPAFGVLVTTCIAVAVWLWGEPRQRMRRRRRGERSGRGERRSGSTSSSSTRK